MAETARRSRAVSRPLVETLEGRMLLSHSARRLPPVDLQYDLARHYASPQSGAVDLTVTRPATQASGALAFKIETMASYVEPLKGGDGKPQLHNHRANGYITSVTSGAGGSFVSRNIRTTGSDLSALPIVPIDGTYRFAPGQASLTIPVRLNPNYVPPGNTSLDVVAFLPRSSRYHWIGSKTLHIEPSLNRVPPEIVSSKRTPQAITLTFSKSMDPATVEDVENYVVKIPMSGQTVRLKSAVYNPATRTVTLMPTAPLTQPYYELVPSTSPLLTDPSRPPPTGVKTPTDLQGNALADGTKYGTTHV